MIDMLIVFLLVGGYFLIEGVFGIVKIVIVKLLFKIFFVGFSRIQFILDLMLSDILGILVFNLKIIEFEFKKGFIFLNMIFIDEINCVLVKM